MYELKTGEEIEEVPLDVMFAAYCRMDPLSNSLGLKLLPLSQSDKWLASAKILDMRKVTTTDTGLCFFKFRRRAITFEEYLTYLEDLAQTKGLNIDDMKFAMRRCGKPVHPQDIKNKKN
ncbi:tubulin polymerization-promoting protein homolog [Athalia rosae]|uniref:tubulin polymerization-promoting protein homolog n=1 Tax=Athalia rosae TaxID=37344 RepID=UPI000626EA25|nr:tubulin polymerization-promoting protein homolog [Athalia rosae]